MESRPDAGADEAAEPIGDRAARGVLWLTVQRWAVRITGFATIAILTRFLSPAEFGVVAAAMTVLPFFYLLSDLGLASYLVQAERTTPRLLDTGFWFSSVIGVLLTGVLVAAAPLIGLVFASDQVVPVLQVLSLSVVVTAFGSVPTALLRRSMRFRTLALQGTAAAVVAQGVAVAMVLSGAGVWALVGQALTAQTLIALLPWFAAHWRPGFRFARSDVAAIAAFGGNVLGVEFVAVLRAWVEAAIIAAAFGMTGLGLVDIARRLVQIVQDLTGSAVVPVSTVAFAKVRESAARTRDAYLRALRLVYAVLSPPLTLVAVAAPLIMPIVFGDGWERSAPIAQVLALAGIMVVGATLDHGLFYGLGKPGRWFAYAVVVDAATVAATLLVLQWGLVAVAWGFLAVAVLSTAARWFLVARLLSTTPLRIARPFGFLLATVAVSGAAGALVLAVTAPWPNLARIAVAGVAILAVHLGVVALLARPVLVEIGGLVARHPLARRFSTRPGTRTA